jgi:hypothetical protein
MPAEPIGPESNATFETADFYATDARGMTFYWVYGAPKHLGGGTFYLLGVRDKDRQLLRGESNYRLTIPARVPAQQFWSVVIYDLATGAFIRESPRVSLSAFVESLRKTPTARWTSISGARRRPVKSRIGFPPRPTAGFSSCSISTVPRR